jgi:hypothetical protein
MTERKTLKSVSIEDVTPRVVLTPIVEVYGETCRIHHIKADSIAVDGRDTFVPLRHVSKQRRRIFELEDENAKLRELILDMLVDEERGHNDDDTYYEHVRLAQKLGIEIEAEA